MTDLQTTQGPFIVRPTESNIPGHLTIAQAKTNEPIAIVPPRGNEPNYADAAMLSSAPHMLDALICIQERLMTSKEPVNLDEINGMISQVFEKIHAEADV